MKLDINLKRDVNAPNLLSLLRLLLVPVYVAFFVKGKKYQALAVFIIASLTDLLDGYLARKHHMITDLGKLLDPLADKLMILAVMFSLAIGTEQIPAVIPWAAVIIVLAKELALIAGGLLALRRGMVVHSKIIGKAAHCVFIAGLVAGFFHDRIAALCPGWGMTPDLWLVWLGVALTLAALIFYVTDTLLSLRTDGRL